VSAPPVAQPSWTRAIPAAVLTAVVVSAWAALIALSRNMPTIADGLAAAGMAMPRRAALRRLPDAAALSPR
jgi:predicted metal-binding membrane protein